MAPVWSSPPGLQGALLAAAPLLRGPSSDVYLH